MCVVGLHSTAVALLPVQLPGPEHCGHNRRRKHIRPQSMQRRCDHFIQTLISRYMYAKPDRFSRTVTSFQSMLNASKTPLMPEQSSNSVPNAFLVGDPFGSRPIAQSSSHFDATVKKTSCG